MKKKIKCLHLVYSGLGGAGNVVLSLIEADKKIKIKQSIIFVGKNFLNDYKKKCKKLKTKFDWIKTKNNFIIFLFIIAYNKIKKHNPDVILIHNFYLIPCVIYKIFFPGTKLVYINHKSLKLLDRKDMLMKYFSFFLDKLVFLNKESMNYAKNFMKLPLSKICMIPNGINTNFFKPMLRKKNFFLFKIGMASRVNKLKCHDLIVDALNSNMLKKFNIEFSLAGDGEDLNNFKNRVKKLKLNKKVKILGYKNEYAIKKWLNNLDLYVQASIGEGVSVSLLQAMSMRVPAIGSSVSGIRELLKKKYCNII